MYAQNEVMLVTHVTHFGDTKKCYGIIFSGEIDDVRSYFTKDKEGIEYKGDVIIKAGDIVPADLQNINTENFESMPTQVRINNLVTFFEGLEKWARTKIPEYVNQDIVKEDNRKYVWQYMHATKEICSGLRSFVFNDKNELSVKSVKDVCLSNLIVHIQNNTDELDKKLHDKKDFIDVSQQLKVIKMINNAPSKYFGFKNSTISPYDETHNDYVLVTDRNEDKTVNGVMLMNLLENNNGQGQRLKNVNWMHCEGGFPLLGDLIAVEQKNDEIVLNKGYSSPKKLEERINNMYFLNDLLFEHYVQKNPKEFNQTVFSAQTHLAKGLFVLLNEYASLDFGDANEEERNKKMLFGVIAKNLQQEYFETKKMANVSFIAKLNKEINTTKPMVDLPKVAISSNKGAQKTLDMF